jgi:cobalt-zinc-cadmium efflux system membrane fusion protein
VRIGDRVEAGQTLATLDSRELAEARGRYLASLSREEIARANYQREADLWKRKVSSEREFLEAKQALAEARVERRLAGHLLHALGLTEEETRTLPERNEAAMTRYEMHAPIDGVVVERHVVPGEVLREDAGDPPFVVADLSTVWVNLTVYAKDLPVIHPGQAVRVHVAGGVPPADGRIDYVAPALEEATRTATARVVLPNPDGLWKPGLFVTAEVAVKQTRADVVVPRGAVQRLEGRDVVFVEHDGRFEPRPVELGARDTHRVAVLAGLRPGERYVAENAFTLKAELSKEGFGGHSH